MAENILKNEVKNHDGATEVTNWISQINAGGTVYDIATHHGITFKDGKGDETGVTWNGLSDLEIVIPNITDIVQTPIEFAGTVTGGEITWVNGHSAPAEVGNLVFITDDCEFNGKACEAGDMAIYAGEVEGWKVVSGENQVSIVGSMDDNNRATIAVGSAKDVLTVEGKTLALTLDYVELDKHVNVSKTNGAAVAVAFGDVTVSAVNLKLNQDAVDTKTIGSDRTFQVATALSDGAVSFSTDSVVTAVSFGTFTEGTLPVVDRNTKKELTVTGGSLTSVAGEVFVTDVSFGKVTFEDAGEGDDNKITMLTGITAVSGNDFVNGIHLTGVDEAANLTIAGVVTPTNGMNTTFVEGLADKSTKVLTGFTAGTFNLVAGNDLVTGFAEGSDVVIDTVTATVNNDTDVLASASVTDHVLSFTPAKVASGVSVSTTTRNLQLTKTGFSYVPSSVTDSEFVTSGFTQADPVKYTFDKAAETTYTPTSKMWKLNTPTVSVSKGAYQFNDSDMIATVDAGTFVETYTAGTLPSWTNASATVTSLTGSVSTALSTADVTVKELTVDSIDLPGAYTLVSVAEGGDVTVAAAGQSVSIAESTVDLAGYLTDVDVTITTEAK